MPKVYTIRKSKRLFKDMRKKAAFLLLAFLITLGTTVGVASQQAQAGQDSPLRVCNSVNSVGFILVYYAGHYNDVPRYFLPPGGSQSCVTMNGGTAVRVDVDPEPQDYGDVDSYYIGQEGEGYGPCHQGENNASDPPNIYPQYVKYNTNAGSC